MKKLLFLTLSMFFVLGIAFSQKTNDGGGKGSGDNKNDEGGGGGTNSCSNPILDLATSFLGSYQTNLLGAGQTTNPSVTSFEVIAQGGFLTEFGDSLNYYTILPRLKINYGALSGDVRFDYTKGTDEINDTDTRNIDALAEFNFIPNNNLKITIGQGVRYELSNESGNTFHESLLGVEIGLNNKQIRISPEIRYVYDWKNKQELMLEGSLNGAFRLFGAGNFFVFGNAGLAYKKLGGETNYGLVYVGLSFMMQ